MASALQRRVALIAGRVAGEATRRLGRGGGTALPGLVAGRLAPDLVEALGRLAEHGAVTVTGTNGKTTTTHLLAAIAREAGMETLTNRSGSNLERGLVTTYVDAAGRDGVADGRGHLGLFEVDEAALPPLFPRLRPRVAVFLNLFRDQLDRYGEIDSVAEGWAAMIAAADWAPALVLNADDPSVALLAEGARGPVVTFGIDDEAAALPEAEHASDARFCVCGSRFQHARVFMGHVGHWRCPDCGRRRPRPDVAATRVLLGVDGSEVDVRIGEGAHALTVPTAGLYSVSNALAALATAVALGVPGDAAVRAVQQSGPAFGRQERFQVGGRRVRVWLAKNPAGLNEIVRALLASRGGSGEGEGREAPDLSLLAMLNDGIQDGQDVSWIYDADLERLEGRVASLVCAGDRAEDLALRLAVAGIEADVVERGTEVALDAALERTKAGEVLDIVATYTAMLEVRDLVAARAGQGAYWEVAP
ncbi:MAG: MurT ligase domain-containing protein [Dehalococcoidia bacterium]|nr:MurT ligase domain-containing protein [Dehalococcoidia bacterium]